MLNVSVRQLGIFEPAYFWDKAPEGIAGNDEWCGVEGFDSKLHDALLSGLGRDFDRSAETSLDRSWSSFENRNAEVRFC